MISIAAGAVLAQNASKGSIGWMISNTDLIVVGTVTDYTFTGDGLKLVVAADQVLKGGGPGSYAMTANVHRSVAGWYRGASRTGRVLPRLRALMFARRVGTEWELIVRPKAITMVEDCVFELPPEYVVPAKRVTDSLEDFVVRIFASHMAAVPKSRTIGDLPESYHALAALARDTRERPGNALQELIADLLSSPSLDSQFLGTLLRIDQNDLSVPALVERADAQFDRSKADYVLWAFGTYSNTSTLSVRSVMQLFDRARNERLREACMNVLHRGHTRTSLPALAKALDSANAKIRGMAVRGLWAFAGNFGHGFLTVSAGPWRYRTDEVLKRGEGSIERLAQPDSVQFWRVWWERYKKELVDE